MFVLFFSLTLFRLGGEGGIEGGGGPAESALADFNSFENFLDI